jgi:hypothetical protein
MRSRVLAVVSGVAIVAALLLVWRIRAAQRATAASWSVADQDVRSLALDAATKPNTAYLPPALFAEDAAEPPSAAEDLRPRVPAAEILLAADDLLKSAAAPCVKGFDDVIAASQRITVHYVIAVIAETANIGEVTVVTSEITDEKLEACILERFRRATWDAPDAPEIRQTRQISFRVGDLIVDAGG